MAVAHGRIEDMFVEVAKMLAVGLAIQGSKIRRFDSVAVCWAKRTSELGLI